MILIRQEAAGHYYYPNGKPCYEVENKSKPGEMRPTTLRDAKKYKLRPSVTTITKMLAKGNLERYHVSEAVKAVLANPQESWEDEPTYINRIDHLRKQDSQDAADLGTAIHKCIEQYHDTGAYLLKGWGDKIEPVLPDIMEGYLVWAEENVREVLESERTFACKEGYGGKTDMLFKTRKFGRDVLADFKGRRTKPNQRVVAYPEMGMQLAAYANGLGILGKVKLWNVIISTTEPGRIEIIDWTETGQEEFEAFLNLFEVWKHVKKYDPTKEQEDA